MNRDLLLVLGLPQSGSLTRAAALAAAGCDFGHGPVEGDDGFERPELNLFHLACYSEFQLNPLRVCSLPPTWRSHPRAQGLLGDLRALLTSMLDGGGRIGIKSTTAAPLLPLYQAAFEELGVRPHLMLCVRSPLSITGVPLRWEFARTTRPSPPLGDLAVGLWLHHTLSALTYAQPDQLTVVTDTVDADGELPGLAVRVLALCRRLASGEGVLAEVADLAAEFQTWREMLAEPGLPGTQVGFAWTSRGKVEVSQVPFLPSGDWQTVRAPIGAPAATEVFGLLYGQPCRVWLRRFVWKFPGGEAEAQAVAGPGSRLTRSGAGLCLEGAYEPRQLLLRSPTAPGPYELEIEFLLEAGSGISVSAARRLSGRLHGRLHGRLQGRVG